MLWFFLSLAAALSVATSDALSKYALKDCDEEVVVEEYIESIKHSSRHAPG